MPAVPQPLPAATLPGVLDREGLNDALNSLDGAIFLLDGQLRVVHCNDGWQQMPAGQGWLNFSSAPERGHPFLWYVNDPARREELAAMVRHVLNEGAAQEASTINDSGRIWRLAVRPWRRGGRVCGVLCCVTEDTALAGAQTQLQQLQKMETLGSLAAGVAHDFNNLLLAIRGNIGLLLMDEETSDKTRERLQQADLASARASDLTQRLLRFSRSTEEKPEIIDFNQVAQETADLARRALRGRVALSVQPWTEAPRVQMNFTLAVQAVLNLCLNGGDAMPPGARDGLVTISNTVVPLDEARAVKASRSPGETFLCCAVQDNGAGIAPEVLPRIFTPFFTTKPRGKGTGLGLPIVHRAIHGAGGFIEVESLPGAGATFRIFLPLNPGPVRTGETELRRQITPGSGRVLLVDDLDLVRNFAVNFLQRAGYTVVAAESAAAALRILEGQAGSIDAVLTDYSMPGESGWQLARQILARWPEVRCVLASGYVEEADLAEIEADGRVPLLNKPYSIAAATALLAETLHGKDY